MSATSEEALYARLCAHEGLAALIGTRVYPLTLPQAATLPALTYQRLPGERVRSVAGATGMMRARYQVHVWAESVSGAKDVSAEVQDALEGWTPAAGGEDDVAIKLARIDDGLDAYDPDPATCHIVHDVNLDYEEPTV